MGDFERTFETGYCLGCQDILVSRKGGYECLGCGALYSFDGRLIGDEELDNLVEENDLAKAINRILFRASQGNGGVIARTF